MKRRPESQDDIELRRRDLERRLRLAYLAGAQHHSRKKLGRSLTEDELRTVIATFPEPTTSR